MVPQDATRAPLGHPWPSLSCHGQRRHVEDGRNPPPSAKLAHLVGRRHRAALRCLGLPGHARAEAAGGGGGEGRRVLPGLECLAQVSPHRSSPAHLAQHRRKGRCATCWPLGRRLARSRPPPPPGGGLRRHRRHRGRRHLPRRHLFSSVDRCEQRSTSPPPLPEVVFLDPHRALAAQRSAASACAPRPCGRHAQAHAPHTPVTSPTLPGMLPGCSPPATALPPPPPLTRVDSLRAGCLLQRSAAVRPARAGTRRAARPCPLPSPLRPALPQLLLARRPARHWRGLTNFTHSLGAGYPARLQKHTAKFDSYRGGQGADRKPSPKVIDLDKVEWSLKVL